MSQEKDRLFKDFEKEVWLYLDADLSESRMTYWAEKIEQYPDLKQCINDYVNVAERYEQIKEVELEDEIFNSMIETAVSKGTLTNKISTYLQSIFSSDKEFGFGKIAFASALIIAAITISLISNKPNPVLKVTENINHELLDWDAGFVDNQISKVTNLLKVAKDDEYRKYYKYKTTTNNVDKNLNLINGNIKTLKREINNKKL